MSQPRLIHITSVEQLRGAATRWDDLWWRSEVTLPTARAELVALWMEHFAPDRGFHALVVEEEGRWTAALPLMEGKVARVVSAGCLPAQSWIGGGLLVDASAQVDDTVACLVAGMRELPWQVLWLEEIPLAASQWNRLRQGLSQVGAATSESSWYGVARIPIDHDWESYQLRWSSKHRQGIGRKLRRLEQLGRVEFPTHGSIDCEQVEALLRRGFEIEDRSWKGAAGSSVLRQGKLPFFVCQGQHLARWGQLELCFLELDRRPIAFCYGLVAKGVFHSCKVGYDPQYSQFSPGQLLRYGTLHRLYHDPKYRAFDCLGMMMNDVHHGWRPSTYTVGQLAIALQGWLGRLALYGHKYVWSHIRRVKYALSRSRTKARSAHSGDHQDTE